MKNSIDLRRAGLATLTLLAAAAIGCGDSNNKVSSADSARRAYLGLDLSIDKAINLGMQGFNLATSANIAPQTGNGDVMGTLVVGGHVDQGASTNKTMNLTTDYTNYEDAPVIFGDAGVLHIIYNAASNGTVGLSMKLANIPSGTFNGTFMQTLHMSGDLQGDVTLSLAFAGDLQPVAGSTSQIQRKPGTTHITGTATSTYGTYTVDITR
jgi:hypothetical protein